MKYAIEELKVIITESTSIRQVLLKLNLKGCGGNYRTIHNFVNRHNIDTSHFTGQAHNSGKKFGPKRPIEEYLNNNFTIQTDTLKKRLISEGMLERKCYKCNLSEWQNHKIPIELHHIDGNSRNNNLSNLQILCPNCHALTDNYRGKNQQKKDKAPRKPYIRRTKTNTIVSPKIIYKCECGNNKSKKSKLCKHCNNKSPKYYCRKTNRPSKDELIELIQTTSFLQIGKKYSVSDNAVRKWCKSYNLPCTKQELSIYNQPSGLDES